MQSSCSDIFRSGVYILRDFGYALYDAVYDGAFVDDCVTGNGSGSYWMNSVRAEEALAGNFDLIAEAVEDFGGPYPGDAETADVLIRCYLLSEVLSDVIAEEYGI